MIGEVKLYAMWGVNSGTVTDDIVVGGSNNTVDSGTGDVTLNALEGNALLQSKVTVQNMSDIVWTAKWKKNGTANNVNTVNCNVSHVKESGTYTFDYEFHSKSERYGEETELLRRAKR